MHVGEGFLLLINIYIYIYGVWSKIYMKKKFHKFRSRKQCKKKEKKVEANILLRLAMCHGLFSIHRTGRIKSLTTYPVFYYECVVFIFFISVH